MAATALGLALVAAARVSAAREPFEVVVRGPVVGPTIAMSRAGYSLLGELGAETAGIRSFADRRLLVSWDLLFVGRGGQHANTEPYLWVYGFRGSAFVEPAWRTSDTPWSPVVSARLASEGSVMWTTSRSFDELNHMDGVGGIFGRGTVRASGGVSYLGDGRSFLAQVFVQELLQTPGLETAGRAFTQLGLGARWDAGRLSTAIEGTWGATTLREEPALQRTARTTRMGVAGHLRIRFGRFWLGGQGALSRDSHHVEYRETDSAYDSADPGDFRFGLLLGASLWGPPVRNP